MAFGNGEAEHPHLGELADQLAGREDAAAASADPDHQAAAIAVTETVTWQKSHARPVQAGCWGDD